VDELPDSASRLAAVCDELCREQLAEGRCMLAGPQVGNAAVAWRARARFDAPQLEMCVRVAGDWPPDDHIPTFSGRRRRRPLLAAGEQLAGGGGRDSAAAAPGPQAR
jgi:hypothetical protein